MSFAEDEIERWARNREFGGEFRPAGYVCDFNEWVYFFREEMEECEFTHISGNSPMLSGNSPMRIRRRLLDHYFCNTNTGRVTQFFCVDTWGLFEPKEVEIIVRMNFPRDLSYEAISGMLKVSEYYNVPLHDIDNLYMAYRLDGGRP